MYDIHILRPGYKLPESGTYFVLARDGFYVRKSTGLLTAMVKVDKMSFLAELDVRAEWYAPSLPEWLVKRTELFFRAVYERYKSEAAVLLHYNSDSGDFHLECPRQQVTPGTVHYESDARFEGFQLIGTIHSHASMRAFHSGTDLQDEMNFDGLHITFGNMHNSDIDISAELAVNGQRFTMDPLDVMEGVEKVEVNSGHSSVKPAKPRKGLLDRAAEVTTIVSDVLTPPDILGIDGYTHCGFGGGYNYRGWERGPSLQKAYRIVASGGRAADFPPEWMRQVSRSTFAADKNVWDSAHGGLKKKGVSK